MAFKSILVPFSGDQKEISALDVAFSLSKDFSAHVSCLHTVVEAKLADYPGIGVTAAALKNLMSDIKHSNLEQAHSARKIFEECEKRHHVQSGKTMEIGKATFVPKVGDIAKIIALRGRLADLIVMGRTFKEISTHHADASIAALFETGRPVVFTPQKSTRIAGDNIAIAWNGSAQASRAIALAMPLLTMARQVSVITIGEGGDKEIPSGEELEVYLTLHGVKSKAIHIAKPKGSVGETLMSTLKEIKADFLVMGAFTHHRLRQMIIGGVTNSIMDQATIPVLMAH